MRPLESLTIFLCIDSRRDYVELNIQDTQNIEESWLYPGNVDDALKVVEGWDPYLIF